MPSLFSGTVDLKFVPQDSGRLTRQIYDRLRIAILSGVLPPGHRLPSSRALAEDFEVSRNTVSSVIDQLTVEGCRRCARTAARGGGGRENAIDHRRCEGSSGVQSDTDLALGETNQPDRPAFHQ